MISLDTERHCERRKTRATLCRDNSTFLRGTSAEHLRTVASGRILVDWKRNKARSLDRVVGVSGHRNGVGEACSSRTIDLPSPTSIVTPSRFAQLVTAAVRRRIRSD
ncbi:hypothetical protein ANTRET_LOCUS7561 [Anthophora retusa]